VTIGKAEGQTFKRVGIDLRSPGFSMASCVCHFPDAHRQRIKKLITIKHVIITLYFINIYLLRCEFFVRVEIVKSINIRKEMGSFQEQLYVASLYYSKPYSTKQLLRVLVAERRI
jgi:hypothetical protein